MSPMDPSGKRRSRGFTLVETAIFFIIVVILLGAAWKILNTGTRIGRTAVQGIALQQGVRGLMENMVRDVNGCLMIAEPNAETLASSSGGPHGKLVVYTSRDQDPNQRLEIQGGSGEGGDISYPFAHLQSETRYRLPVYQITYEYDGDSHTVSRLVVAGDLYSVVPAPGELAEGQQAGVVQSYEFQAGGVPRKRVLAREVEYLRLYPFSYDHSRRSETSGMPRVALTHRLPGAGARMDETAGVALRVKASYHQEQEVKRAQDSSMEIVTRIWSYPKLFDHIYRPYFSSVDRDLRY